MDSPEFVVSPFKNLTVSGAEPKKQMADFRVCISNGTDNKAAGIHNPKDFA